MCRTSIWRSHYVVSQHQPNYFNLAQAFAQDLEEHLRCTFYEKPGVPYGTVVFKKDRYIVVGPAYTLTDYYSSDANLYGLAFTCLPVSVHNSTRKEQAQHAYLCHSREEALATLWALVVEHYALSDGAQQAQQYQLAQYELWDEVLLLEFVAWLRERGESLPAPDEEEEDWLSPQEREEVDRYWLDAA